MLEILTSLRRERPDTKPKGTQQPKTTNEKEDPRQTEAASKVGQANSPGGAASTDGESDQKTLQLRGAHPYLMQL